MNFPVYVTTSFGPKFEREIDLGDLELILDLILDFTDLLLFTLLHYYLQDKIPPYNIMGGFL